jgi:hypothetical protein
MEETMTADLLTSTATVTGTRTGTKLVPALDQKLAGTEPLLDVVAWYGTQFNGALSVEERLGLEGNANPTTLETATFAVYLAQGNPDFCSGGCRGRGTNVCVCLAMLESARAALQAQSSSAVVSS